MCELWNNNQHASLPNSPLILTWKVCVLWDSRTEQAAMALVPGFTLTMTTVVAEEIMTELRYQHWGTALLLEKTSQKYSPINELVTSVEAWSYDFPLFPHWYCLFIFMLNMFPVQFSCSLNFTWLLNKGIFILSSGLVHITAWVQ